ncbi:MAG: CoB--CoM heterodisulfide reductase iron-sulfur subunit A family protein [Bacteroidales bacterium]|nr:CoB--CoM heterodisulfide reductase iron-sulfur subunit A family protein [Bacteroidales bacterium]
MENVLIIGGGPAGLEAAATLLKLKEYNPIIVESANSLGGHLSSWHKLFPDMTDASMVLEELKEASRDACIFLSTTVLSIYRLKDGYLAMLSNGVSVNTKYVIVCSGFSLFEAEKKEEYGYGIYNQVMTNSDLERWLCEGSDSRISDREIKKAGFVHCVGSRDLKAGNTQCSKVCCVTAIKQAIELKKHFPEAEIYCFYIDLRLFGRKYEDFYIKAQKEYGIHFIRGRVSEVGENKEGQVVVKAEDTLSGKPVKVTLDLLVLMSGMACNRTIDNLARSLTLSHDSDGFLRSANNVTGVVRSSLRGVYYAGACTGPKTIPETLAEARSAAMELHFDCSSEKNTKKGKK